MADLSKLVVTVAADVSGFTRGLGNARTETERFASSARASVEGVRSTFASVAALAGTIGLGIGVGESIGILKEVDALKASLRTAEGSATGATQALERLRKLSQDTQGVLSVNELTQAYIRLKNLGLDASNESLKSFANTALAQSKTLDQFIEAVADAATGEFERLKEFGIRASKTGQEVTFTFQGMSQTVGFSAAEIQKYLTDLGNSKFGDGIKNQADALGTSIKQIEASFQNLVVTIGNLGITDALRRAFSGATDFINGFAKQLNAVFGSGLQSNIDAFEGRLTELRGKLADQRSAMKTPLIGGLLASPEDMRQTEQSIKDMERALGDLRAQKAKADAEPIISPVPAAATQSIQAASSGMDKLHKTTKAAKASTVELTDAFAEFAKKNGEILPGGSFAEIIQTQQADLKKVNADDITSVFEELQKKQLDDEIINPKTIEDTKKLSDATRELGLTFSSAFESAVIGGRGLSDVLKGLAQDISGLALRKLFTEPAVDAASSAVSGFDWTSILGSVFGGFMASGGSVQAGKAYVVGERQPELFVPSTSGSIIPSIGGAGGMNVQIIDQRGSGAPAIEQQRSRDPSTGVESLRIMIRDEMKSALASGHLDKSMTLNFGVKRQGISR